MFESACSHISHNQNNNNMMMMMMFMMTFIMVVMNMHTLSSNKHSSALLKIFKGYTNRKKI